MHLDLSDLQPAFLTAEARAAGVDGRRLHTAADAAHVRSLGRGVWSDVGRWPEDRVEQHRLLAAAAQRAVAGSAVSHVSAALLHGLPNPARRLPRPAVTVHDGVRSRSPGSWMSLFRGDLLPQDVTSLDGVPVTNPARTAMDCVRHLSLGDALAIIDSLLRSGDVSRTALVDERRRQTRWPGISAADIALRLADARRESWLESFSAAAFHRTGLPPAIPQVLVYDEWGDFLGRVDGAWADLGVVGEADGKAKYLGTVDPSLDQGPDAVSGRLVESAERETRIRATGLGVVRWTTAEIMQQLLRVRARWVSEVARTDARRVRAVLQCSCCRRDLASCDLSAV